MMVQGTASSVGKSLVSAALCRIYARRGLAVAPFKSQNMSNNAAAIGEGLEIGRAQALQAAAAGVEPSVDMNPILLKPETDARAQIVLMGRPWKTVSAGGYGADRPILWEAATDALARLRASADLVVIEGAGSPAEINLREGDIVNMAVARHAGAPVLLVGDIDPGGVFAQFAGTLALLLPPERALVKGLIINKFRGDRGLLDPGLRMIEGREGLPVLGVVPWLPGLGLAEEDAQSLPRSGAPGDARGKGGLDIAVIHYPHIANFDDFDALGLEDGVRLRFVERAEELGWPDAVVLPGTKATLADLDWLRAAGLDEGVRWLARAGRGVVGICGGYQMLGRNLSDPDGVEGPPRVLPGLGLLEADTRFVPGKHVGRRRGRVIGGPGFFAPAAGLELEGYEIHAGETHAAAADAKPLFRLEAHDDVALDDGVLDDGAASRGGLVWGSYLHGIFDLPAFRRAWLASLPGGDGAGRLFDGKGLALADAREAALDRLADAVEAALDMDSISRIAGIDASSRARKEHA